MLCGLVFARAEDDPAATFLSAYTEFQNGEKLERDGDLVKALAKFRAAASTLQQVSRKSPDWQPLVVEYRLRKVQEGIQRLQGQIPSAPEAQLPNSLEGSLPTNPDLPATPPPRSVSPESRYAPEPVAPSPGRVGPRQELQQAQQTIRELRDKLEVVSGRVRSTSTEIDRLKVKLVEKDSQLVQTQIQLANLKKDDSKGAASQDSIRKEFQAEVDDLKKQLAITEADKEVLEEENSQLMVKLEKASSYITASDSIRTALEKERKELAADRDKSTTRVEKSEGELKKAMAELADSRERISKIEKLTSENRELEAKLKASQKTLDKDRAENKESAKLVAESQQKALEASRVIAQNKELITRLNQSDLKLQNLELVQKENAALVGDKEELSRSLAGKTVELEAATRQLSMQPATPPQASASPTPEGPSVASKEVEDKLVEAEKMAVEYQKAQAEKEAELKEMQSQVNSVNDRLFAVRADLVARDTRITDLEKQLDSTSGDLAKLKLANPNSDQQQAIAENELLRGVILRQIREQARKDQAKRLVDEEIARLKVSSDTLSEQLNVLAEPFQLSDEEKKLFRAPIELSEEPNPPGSDVELSLTVAKTDSAAPVPAPAPARKVGGMDSLKEENQPLARNAKTAFDQGDTAGAEKIYQQIVDSEPNNPYALSQLGAVQFEAGKVSAAEVALKKSLDIIPNDAFALTILGIVHYRQQKYDESIRELEQAIAADPKRAMSYNYLGIVYSELNNLKRAEEMLQKAIDIKPDYADAHFNLAIIYASQQPPAKELARRHYQKATQMGAAPDASLEKMMQ